MALGPSLPSDVEKLIRQSDGEKRPGMKRSSIHMDNLGHLVATPGVDALEHFDLDRLVALLTQDARLTMPPEPFEFRGPLAIAGFMQELPFWGRDLKLVATRANNQPAFGYYVPDPCAPIWRTVGIMVLALEGDRICGITRFGDHGLLARFGMPRTLPRN